MFLSPQKLQPILAILCILLASVCQADVNTVARNQNNNNYNYKRQQQQQQRYTLVRTPQRLQRVQAAPTPYPASGYRPDRTFALPANQGGQAVAAQPAPTQITRPDQLYAAPAARLRQPAPAPAPARQTTTFFPAPQLAYAAPARIQQQAVFAAPQQTYVAPAAQPARILQQQQQQQQQPAVFYAAPQQQYGTPRAEAPKPAETEELAPVPAATPARLVNAAKPARLTATREDREDDADDTQQQAVDIDADEPANNQSPKAAVAQPQPQPQPQLPVGATITYFPTNAYNFVQPFAVQQPTVAGKVYAPQPAAPLIAAAPLATSQQFVAQPQYYASPQFAAFTAAASPYQLQAW